jgi:hypothetical protein
MTAMVGAAGAAMPPLPAQVQADAPATQPAQPAAQTPVQSVAPPAAPVAQPVAPPVAQPAVQPPAQPASGPVPASTDATVQALLRQNQQLLDRLAAQSRPEPADAPEKPEPDFVPRIERLNVSAAERDTFGPAESYIRALAREEVLAALEQLVPEFNKVRQRTAKLEKDLDKRVGSVTQQTFSQALYAAVPDFDALVADAAFNAYLDKPLPYQPGRTIRSLLAEAYRAQDVATIRANVDLFRRQAAPASAYVAPDPSALVHPVVAGGGQPAVPVQAPTPEILTASQRMADYSSYRSGKMPHDQWMQRQALYDKAMIEGRFDPNK